MAMTLQEESLNVRLALAILALDDARTALTHVLAEPALSQTAGRSDLALLRRERDGLASLARMLGQLRPTGIITRTR